MSADDDLACLAYSLGQPMTGSMAHYPQPALKLHYVEEIRKWRSTTSYMERYVAKPEVCPEGVETGRVWGAWNEEMLPVQWETVKVSLKGAYKIRRIYRRLAKRKGTGPLRRLTVFIRYESVVRLLECLAYREEE